MTERDGGGTRDARAAALTVVVGVVAAVLAWQLASVLLSLFSAVLLAILMDGLTRMLRARVPIPRAAGLALVILTMLGASVFFWWLVGPQLSDQVALLVERVPEAVDRLDAVLRETETGRILLQETPSAREAIRSGAQLAGRVPGMFSSLAGAVTNTLFALLAAVYLVFEPDTYHRGFLQLVPPERRARAADVLAKLGSALRWWLVGRAASMVAVGLLTGVALWLIDLPLALALGVIAGIFAFVPFLGPVGSAIPAILIALVEGPLLAAWVVMIYAGVQFLEGNLITPLIQERVASVPAALLLASQLTLGVLFGLVGVLLATPLAVGAIVLVRELWVREVLGETPPGDGT